MTTPQTVKTSYVEGNGVVYAYRRLGKHNGGVPLLMLHHFRGFMDFWDPLFISSLAAQREVILFDNAGCGKSTGEVPDSIKGMADHVTEFLASMKIYRLDIYGFSIGGYIAQQLVLDHPDLVRKLILSGTGPGVGIENPNIANPNAIRIGQLAANDNGPDLESMKILWFYPSESSRAAADEWWVRVHERTKETSGEERDTFVKGAGLLAQKTALGKWKGGEGEIHMWTLWVNYPYLLTLTPGSFGRLHEIKCPVLITNGKDDFMVPTPESYAMFQQIPNAQLILFPNSGHGHCFQYALEYCQHVGLFLEGVRVATGQP
jgi:pimeloyl-ACP methyl ester carboxylesterase